MSGKVLTSHRSFTGNHNLLPAIRPSIPLSRVAQQPGYSFLSWTFGRGTVIWRIWPAVLLYSCFSAGVVALKEQYDYNSLAIPNVMLTVLGVVIGFVISYRAISGYERYWMGRTAWSDVIRNCRAMGRMVWFHVPPLLTTKTPEEIKAGQISRTPQELTKVMNEKRMALDLIEGYAVALKHHIRGETGIYYEDLYHLVRPLHDHDHSPAQKATAAKHSMPPPGHAHRIASSPSIPQPTKSITPSSSHSSLTRSGSTRNLLKQATFSDEHDRDESDPYIPPINAYGTFDPTPSRSKGKKKHRLHRTPSGTSLESATSDHQPLQPAQNPADKTMMSQVDKSLIPFAGMLSSMRRWFSRKLGFTKDEDEDLAGPFGGRVDQRKWTAPLHPRIGKAKHNITSTGVGENLPAEILRCLSEWFSVLEDRGTVPGTTMGMMIASIPGMEDSLSTLERILTTPLPFVYSVHIKHTVWIYLFFLPFQLVKDFHWHAVPGVTIAAFIYLGFLAAGEEIEQPFGYDENDLDLDMFCQEVIHVDMETLKKSPCLNAYLPPQERKLVRHQSMTLIEATELAAATEDH